MTRQLLPAIRMLHTKIGRKVFYPKLFVANLPWTISNTELSLYFSKFGQVADANVKFDPESGLSRAFGYVEFTHTTSYENALNAKSHLIEGRMLKIAPATRYDQKVNF